MYNCESHEYIPEYEKGVEYNRCADSETIARYLDKYEYDPNKVEEVLKRFEGISKKESISKVLKNKNNIKKSMRSNARFFNKIVQTYIVFIAYKWYNLIRNI